MGEQCDGSDLGGTDCTSLGHTAGGILGCTAGCNFDLSLCESQAFPSTGRVTCSDPTGAPISCTGTGHDGEVKAGAPLAYRDNGDGTITDLNTGLMWEKLSDDGSIHDWDDAYIWEDAFAVKIATLNSPDDPFAGHTDWRMPNVKELASIVDYGVFNPTIDPAFDNGCSPICTVLTCSCTVPFLYWSSSSVFFSERTAWLVNFTFGHVSFATKRHVVFHVRAVRGP